MVKQIRHGDVLLVRLGDCPQTKRERSARVVLAEGEVTGHAHIASGPGLRYNTRTRRLLVPHPAELNHEEHGLVVLEPGEYDVIRQVEFVRVQDNIESRHVRD